RGGQTIVINNPPPREARSYDASTPAYRYPPTGSFWRDDELHGSIDSSKAQTPDYSRVQPAPYAPTRQTSRTGGGSAVSNKTGVTNATSAQSGGSGSGTAASNKGGFSSGSQSYTNSAGSTSGVGAGSKGVLPKTTTNKPSTGLGGGISKGI